MICPNCNAVIKDPIAQAGGRTRSAAKSAAARRNGRLGGRPKKRGIKKDPSPLDDSGIDGKVEKP